MLEHDLPDFYSLVQCFAHIVHGQRGYACCYQSFHLNSGNCIGYNFGGNSDAILAQPHGDINVRKGQWMAHGD